MQVKCVSNNVPTADLHREMKISNINASSVKFIISFTFFSRDTTYNMPKDHLITLITIPLKVITI